MFSEDLRTKAAQVLFAGQPMLSDPVGAAANPLVTLFLQFLQSLLGGGICPTPKAKVEFAQRRPFIFKLRAGLAAANATDDPAQQQQLVDGAHAMVSAPTAVADAEALAAVPMAG